MALCVMVALAGFLVTARLTRFVTDDELFSPVRDRVANMKTRRHEPWLLSLMLCPWCASVWIAAPLAGYGTYLADWPAPGWAVFASLWLGWSYLTGFFASVVAD